MKKLHIVVQGDAPLEFVARMEEAAAPNTCAAFRSLLPYSSQFIHCRWSGEAVWIPLGDADFGLTYENHTSHPAPGHFLFHPGGFSEAEIIVAYGSAMFSSKLGQLAGNHFLTIVEGIDQLAELGRRVLWEGAQNVVFKEFFLEHEPMAYHRLADEIRRLLDEGSYWYETFEHEPVRTSEEAARTRPGYSLQQGAKAIVVRTKTAGGDKRFVMLVFPADQKFDSKKARTALSVKDVRFASESEVAEVTGGVEVGAVPPFGNLFGLEVAADRRLFDNERIVFNAGDRRFSIAMKAADYRTLVDPVVVDII